MHRGSTNPRERWVELFHSRVSHLIQLSRCREGCSARAPTGFELPSSCRARRLLTVFVARAIRLFARVSTRDLLSQSTSADCQSSYSSSHEIAITIADFSAWYELLHRPVGACHRSMMSSPLITTIPAPHQWYLRGWTHRCTPGYRFGRCLIWQPV